MKSILPPLMGKTRVIFSLFLSYFLFSSSQLRAQTIPDASFAEAIRAVCPTCIDASNTLTSVAATRTSLDVSARGIADLTGLEGFTSLQTLICNSNKITSLPTLPSGLTMLLCDVNQLTLLPILPSGLASLSCNYNQLSFLPALPEGLTAFSCNNNQLVSLPALPKNLTSLSCSNNLLRALPELPEKLQVLFCFSNQISQLPALTESLNTLYCFNNQIYCLPVLPNALSILHIDVNKITCFLNFVPGLKTYNANGTMIPTPPVCTIISDPNFAAAIRSACSTCIGVCNNLTPAAEALTELYISGRSISNLSGIEAFKSLRNLNCEGNKLTSLPGNLSATLTSLNCSNNQLTTLPALPNSITNLSCYGNQLTNLPNLPTSLLTLNCSSNQLAAIGDLPKSLTNLDCYINQLTSLPVLPEGLKYLNCYRNKLTNLPILPNTLLELYSYNNQLSSLPVLPNSLRVINVDNNLLTNLPELPSNLTQLSCRNNLIQCLPILPNSLYSLYIDGTNTVKCIPNVVKGLYISNTPNGTLPVCGVADANFARAIRSACPSCMDECYKLTPEAASVTSLDISDKNITSLAGIEAFTSLQSLNCSKNQLACLPPLPKSLTSLTIDADKITCLPGDYPDLKVYNASEQLISTPGMCTSFIPDVNFANAIRSSCSACIDQCNNLLPPAATLTYLSISGRNITDLTGIEGFKALQTLYCNSNKLTSLPKLPSTLIYLDCSSNQLTGLSDLPAGLTNLYCYNNKFVTISNLPGKLTTLECSNNQLTGLPDLPAGLTNLQCYNNKIAGLPALPDNLTQINCSDNLLAALPALPGKLTRLSCDNNKLTALPELPATLNELYCSNNQLTCLPFLPTSLRYLSIYNNVNIKCLPNSVNGLSINSSLPSPIPICGVANANFARAIRSACPSCMDECYKLTPEAATITSLDLSDKNITSLAGLEAFTSLQSLNCSKNQLVCLPPLPKTLTSLTIDADKITCLPGNYPDLKVYNASGQLIPTPGMCTSFIPDVNFANAIRYTCPTCIDQCNNLLAPAATLTSLGVSYQNISDLTGIEGFKSLKNLTCNGNKLTTLPKLPATLTYLDCNYNQLIELTNLPVGLTNLQCYNNKINNLSALPGNLTQLNCSTNLLTALPVLPSKLTNLSCSDNKLTVLPELPATLYELNCSSNQLSCLPFLPNSLRYLSIYSNANIKCLPNSVNGLSVSSSLSNPIPICGVADADFARAIRNVCSNCMDECYKLTPEVASVISLDLSDKNITNLSGIEAFISLQNLNCSKNQLACLPPLPKSLTSLTIDADKITCLPGDYPDLKIYNASGQLIPTPGRCLSFIPDVNFANAIRSNCSNCIDQCNNLLPPAATLTYLYISNRNISDLTGIEGFKALQTLYCDNNKLATLPKLPAALTYLSCSNNQLKQLPELPATLTYLNCSYNQLSQLPELSVTLRNLYCHYNRITCLPPLPLSLSQIQLDVDKIFCIPAYNSLQSIINQNGNTLTNFPVCSNPIVLSDITASANNPIAFGGSVTFRIQRNLTGAVSVKWQRKKANEADFMDITTAAIVYNLNNDMTYTASNLALTDDGNSYRVVISSPCIGSFISKSATIEVRNITFDTPIVTSSPKDTVCVGQTVRLSAACPSETTVEWNTGATGPTIDVKSVSPLSRSYTAKCVLGSNKTDSSPAKVIVWKPLEVTLINIAQSQSGIKPGVSVPMSAWNNQFVTPDAGPDLHTSTQVNPTIYYIENTNKTTPRYWTAHVDACDLPATGSISYDMLATPEVGAPMSFNTHENSAPYLMYANRDGFTELYAQNNVFFGFYEKDNTGQNRYDAGLPKGLYKLSIRYWNQKGNGLAPAVRVPQGTQLSYQEHWFRIQSQAGVGSGTARTAFNNDQLSDRRTAVNNDQWAEVSPNPVSKTLRLNVNDAKGKSVNVSLVDAWGRTLLQRIFVPETNRHQEEFEVSDKAAGMYLMRVNSSAKQTVLKVIKTE